MDKPQKSFPHHVWIVSLQQSSQVHNKQQSSNLPSTGRLLERQEQSNFLSASSKLKSHSFSWRKGQSVLNDIIIN